MSLTSDQVTALQTELTKSIYQATITNADDQGTANLLNTLNSAIRISRGIISKDNFITFILNPLGYLLSLDSTNAARAPFNPWLLILQMTNSIDTTLPEIATQLQEIKTVLDSLNAANSQIPTLSAADINNVLTLEGTPALLILNRPATAQDVTECLAPQRLAAYQSKQQALIDQMNVYKSANTYPGASDAELLQRADQLLNGSLWGHS
jgi:hypothetical protein